MASINYKKAFQKLSRNQGKSIENVDSKEVQTEKESINLDIPEQYKTLLQLSKELGTDKQKIYRCIHKYNIPFQKINDVMYLDEVNQTLLKSVIFPEKTVSKNESEIIQKTDNEAVLKQLEKVIEILQEELKSKTQQLNEKDKQIAELTRLVDQQQQLHAVEQKKVLQLEQKNPEKKKGFFWRQS